MKSVRKNALSKPLMNWQTGDYKRHASFEFVLPCQFLLLCKLTDCTPRQLMLDFLENLDCGSSNREGRNMAKEFLLNYFIEMGYGQSFYSPEEIMGIFREMDSIGMLFPFDAKLKLLDLHVLWRNKYHKYLFKKWFRKIRRKV